MRLITSFAPLVRATTEIRVCDTRNLYQEMRSNQLTGLLGAAIENCSE